MLTDMEAEHALIDPMLQDCEERFDAIVGGAAAPDDAGAQLSERLVAARRTLGEHLRHEETDAMAMVQRKLTQKQWDRMAKESFGADQTVRDLLSTLPWVLHRVPRQQAADMFRSEGRPFMVLWWLTRRGFERREAAAARHVPEFARRR